MYSIYRIISFLLWPFLKIWAAIRLRKGKEISHRLSERYGHASHDRPQGRLVWIHAASNGEALSALPLIHMLRELPSAPTILMTTMTVTAANIMQQRMPNEGCIHQFIPYDHPAWVDRLINYWAPNMVIWTESELWPNHLHAIKKRNIPAILANGRLSAKSTKRWEMFSSFFTNLMDTFDLVMAQSPDDLDRLKNLGLSDAIFAGNLKDIALPLPYDSIALDDLRLSIGQRPVLLFASTHKGEEDIAIQCHKALKYQFPNLLSIIIPRHPFRALEITHLIDDAGLKHAVRSLKMSPRNDTDIYVADTVGEMGLFYTACPIVFVGNSMNTKPGGGHNLMEPALLNCAIVSGDDLHNFSIMANEMPKADACIIVSSQNQLEKSLSDLLQSTERQNHYADNAYAYATQKQALGIDSIMATCNSVFQRARLL